MIKKKKVLLLLLFSTVFLLGAVAQNSNGITIKFSNETLSSAFQRLEKASGNKIMFTYEDVQQYRVDGQVTNATFEEAMHFLLNGKPLERRETGNRNPCQTATSDGR